MERLKIITNKKYIKKGLIMLKMIYLNQKN